MSDTAYVADTDWIAPQTVGEYDTKFPTPEEGTYVFQLVEKSPDFPKDEKFNPDGTKMQAKFFFKILDDPDYADQTVMQFFSTTFNKKAKIRPFVEAGIGRALRPTDKVGWKQNPNDPDSVGIEGIIFKATLTHNANGYAVLQAPMKLKESDKAKYQVPF
jgi:hypothetical protein